MFLEQIGNRGDILAMILGGQLSLDLFHPCLQVVTLAIEQQSLETVEQVNKYSVYKILCQI